MRTLVGIIFLSLSWCTVQSTSFPSEQQDRDDLNQIVAALRPNKPWISIQNIQHTMQHEAQRKSGRLHLLLHTLLKKFPKKR